MLTRFFMFPEAAVRSQKQAESEDCDQVDIEHFEKMLPQLVGGDQGQDGPELHTFSFNLRAFTKTWYLLPTGYYY